MQLAALQVTPLCNIAASRIAPAAALDAGAIYALKIAAFGNSTVPYTIYQAPASQRYLAELIEGGPAETHQYFFVVKHHDLLEGYYHAVQRQNEFFLNYIAVAVQRRGSGLGNLLLRHYEATGQSLGCELFSLDVFENNRPAVEWYFASGYNLYRHTFLCRIALDRVLPRYNRSLTVDDAALSLALDAEKQRGFSKLETVCSEGRIELGLINGKICKLLKSECSSLDLALAAIAGHFGRTRDILIFTTEQQPLSDWPVLSCHKCFRLEKQLCRRPHPGA